MKRVLPIILAFLIFDHSASAAPVAMPNPDFTKGESIPKGEDNDIALGATGARGWIYSYKLSTRDARQVYVTKVAVGSPADGVLQVGDVLLGVAGKPFADDIRKQFGQALTAAEIKGKLIVTRWRAGKTEEIAINLPVLGSYSKTAPYDCPKSKAIMDQGCQALAKRIADPAYEKSKGINAITRSLNGLGLLASGDAQYYPLLKKEAEWAADQHITSMATWYYGYLTTFLAEYVIATGDQSVLPGLRRISMEAAKGQSNVGSWGHRFAQPDGRLPGYGMMHSPGVVMSIGLVLARKAGVNDPEVAEAISRSTKMMRFYIGKGAVPYGDHAPFMAGHEDNGKCGMTTVLFDELGEKDGAEFFSKMSLAAHGEERDCGHTGNFFNTTWAMPGVARSGPNATGAWMEEYGAWYFDLARNWDGSFSHQGPPSGKGDSYKGWDATGLYLIAYGMPRKAIHLTGKEGFKAASLSADVAKQVVRDGRGFSAFDYNADKAYAEVPPDQLIEMLSNWSPVVRERAGAALGRNKSMTAEPLIPLLGGPSIEARLGACTVLAYLGERSAAAAPKLRELLKDDHLWLRVKAAEALAAIGQPAMVTVPDLLQMLAKGPTSTDPRAMEQRFIVEALFNSRKGLLRSSFEGVDREQLLAAVRVGLRNEDGRTRGGVAPVYKNLSFDELRPLMPAIHQAIIEKSPSGEMFDGQIQNAGLELFSKNRVSEGIELTAQYVMSQKKHGSNVTNAKLLALFKNYGAHAQRAIPLLEKAADYFENNEEDFPKNMSLIKAKEVRATIKEIQAMTEKPELIKLGL